jgi:hypothetical protein
VDSAARRLSQGEWAREEALGRGQNVNPALGSATSLLSAPADGAIWEHWLPPKHTPSDREDRVQIIESHFAETIREFDSLQSITFA